ncbi:uncharacterized protein MONOS_1463 [Monocercomonoides exilis]|uniref:uncharacterized protein n=1 Tax=Monocercomonoides exilis TaxID=2049356 RepID=UPI003559BC95|nr:hypothetical protein MONOS_1463 [Monocercomonoides exilis]|eukprot:MONOS_1463.1-p1 / transcript=MONOS_1463.1 / gene=MONOS_1463 / organism=Monocercomonoides_exilis_PA203 / gene_product=unspecified product / transcript_product=unspecified product / location=Mono_scaffold00026:51014-56724(-) / protein_length=1863 / sequence_SO=supercontig / SO=protein_coding / is_pseudo=false
MESEIPIGYVQSEGLSKHEIMSFSIFFTLFNQPKHPSKKWEIFMWTVTMLQMVTISFFRIDTSTQEVNRISKYLCYLDGSSLGYLAGTSISFVLMGCAAYFVLLTAYLVAVAAFQGVISGSQPWVISLLRWTVNVTYTILFIPLTSICITIFDCYESGGQTIHRGFEGSCFGDLLLIFRFVISIVVLSLMLISSIFINNMIFNHNPKHGGLWSSPSGLWQAVDSSLVFGCVFAMRMLYGWPFWRGAVTIGSSLVMMVYFVYIQPIYKLNGNLLMGSKWCLFGCLRLIDEILYAIEGATGNWIITIVLQVVGLIAGIVACAVLLPKIGRKMREKKYLLTAFGNQLSDICTKNPSLALPPLKKPERVEPSLRFIQQKEYNSMIHLTFADYVYTHALKTNPNNSMLCFQYATFLAAYRKNYMKANGLIQKARSLSPNLFLRFVLFCKTKENDGRANGENARNGRSGLNSYAFTTLRAKAEKHHELAVSAMKDFFENATAVQPDFKAIPVLLNSVVKNEEIARKSYEELIESHEQSAEVLRSYARLLLDIYDDEDEAEMILNRADSIEEDSTSSYESSIHTHAAEIYDASLGAGEKDKADDRMKRGNERISCGGDGSTKRELGDAHSERTESFGVSMRYEEKDGREQRGAEGRFETSPSSYELLNYDSEQVALASNEMQLHQSSSYIKRHQKSNKKKRKKKKKKKNEMIVDLMSGGRGKNGDDSDSMNTMRCSAILLHLTCIIALVVAIAAYITMTTTYKSDLDTLRAVCDLSYHTARSACISYNFFVYDIRFKFEDPAILDEWTPTMVRKKELLTMLQETSENMASMLGRVHGSTSNLDPWEAANIDTYMFIFSTKNETQPDGSVEEVVGTKKQILQPSSMLEVLATLSQMLRHLSVSDMSSRPKDPNYLADMQYLVFNCPVPILDGAKKVILSYFERMNSVCDKIIIVFILFITLFLVPLTIVQLVIFIVFTKKSVKVRMRAYHAMLDVPKNKMQSVVRRLLSDDEDAVDDFQIEAALNGNQNEKEPESSSSEKHEQFEDDEAQLIDESTDESEPSSLPKKNMRNIIGSGRQIEEKQTDSKANSPSVRKTLQILDQSDMELDPERSSYLLLSSANRSMDSITGTPFSRATPKSLLGELTASTSSTPVYQFQTPRIDEENTSTQTTEQNSRSCRSSPSMPQVPISAFCAPKPEVSGNDVFNTDMVESASKDIAKNKSLKEDNGANGNKKVTTESAFKEQLSPVCYGNANNGIQTSQQQNISQRIPLANPVPSMSFLPVLLTGIEHNPHRNLTAASLASAQTSISEHDSELEFGVVSMPPSVASSNPFMQNNLSPCWQNDLPLQMDHFSPIPPVGAIYAKTDQNSLGQGEPHVQTQPPQQNGAIEAKFTLDDEDSEEAEKNKQAGLIRNAVEDTFWEEGMEKEVEKLEATYKQLPTPITIKIVVTCILSLTLGIVTIVTTVALVLFYVGNYRPTSANIIMSGMRASILFQIQFLLSTILQPIQMIKTDQSVTFPTSSNPVMHNSSHCSGSPVVARDMLVPMSKYFEAVHLDCHFGDSDYTHTNDYTYDSVSVKRMNTAVNHQLLLQKADCFLADSDDCSQVDEYRMYGVKGTIYGLTTLLSRLRVNLERISKMDVSDINLFNPEARFVMTALRSDITAGLNKMTNMILATGKEEVQESITTLTVVVASFCFLYFISMFGNGLTYIKEIEFIETVSKKLFELLPVKEDEREIEMVPSMMTGNDSFDKGREAILDAAQQLLTSINQNDDFETVVSAFYQLSSTALAIFNEEEKEMAVKNYPGIEKHKKEHMLLRQRLTLIGDQLHSKNDAAKAIGKRKLISLFDVHFTDEDITFAEAVFELNICDQKQ